jgi:predicted CXXCH cytochrome family protein
MKIGCISNVFRNNAGRVLFLFVFFGFFSALLFGQSFLKESFAQEKAKPADQLTNADCIKCHAAVVKTVETKGGKHKTAVTCMDCHQGHPPMVKKENIIPACSTCHNGKPHFKIGNCNTCHSDPHAPLQMKLAANLTAPCLSCHEKQGKELKDHQTLHSKLFCTTCHKQHKQIPSCLQCHQPHSPDMVNKDCLKCHPAHQPRTITYGQDMPSKLCASCHKNIYDTLSNVKTKHSKLTCVFCHKNKHGYVPACQSCHGTPHPEAMLKKFPKCVMCHVSAHSLGKEATK